MFLPALSGKPPLANASVVIFATLGALVAFSGRHMCAAQFVAYAGGQCVDEPAQRIEWTNEDEFQRMRSGPKYITFRVLSKETRKMTKLMERCLYLRVHSDNRERTDPSNSKLKNTPDYTLKSECEYVVLRSAASYKSGIGAC